MRSRAFFALQNSSFYLRFEIHTAYNRTYYLLHCTGNRLLSLVCLFLYFILFCAFSSLKAKLSRSQIPCLSVQTRPINLIPTPILILRYDSAHPTWANCYRDETTFCLCNLVSFLVVYK